MTVYADMVFLVNFIMDCFILWIVSVTGRKKTRFPWVALGGFVMALLYCLLIFTEAFRYINTAVASALILAIGVTVSLRPAGVKPFARMLLIAYGVSFTVGGLGMVLFYLTDLPYAAWYLFSGPETAAGGLTWKLPAICIGASYIIIKLGIRVWENAALKRQLLCPVRIIIGAEDVELDALVDTGHNLREPITQAPVIIAEFERVKHFLPDALKLLYYERQEDELNGFLDIRQSDSPFYNRVRMIPFNTIGKTHGMLIGFRPDKVAVSVKREQKTYDGVVIGIYNSRLTKDGRYQGLLSPELI